MLINIYAPNTRAPKDIKQILTDIRGEIVNNTLILILHIYQWTDHPENQWGNSGLKWHIAQLDITDIYKTFHPQKAKYSFSSSVHETFSRIDHMLGHKTSFNNFKRIEIISSIFFWPHSMKLEINYRKKWGKIITWSLNNILLKQQQ